MKVSNFFEKILSFLRVRPRIGGLEVSDSFLRLSYFDGQKWALGSVRLAPGVVVGGQIKDGSQFKSALLDLKTQAFGPAGAKKTVNVIVALSSISIYIQVFSLPIIEGENLEKAIQLNIQMISPVETSQAYSGWQLVGEDKGSLRLEVLSAFIDRSVVDSVNNTLLEAGLVPVVMESRALSLARLVRLEGAGVDASQSYIILSLDDSGLDLLVARRGQLYFEYFNPWRDLTDEKGQIAEAAFEAAVTRSLHQVLNFYGQHWPEPVAGVIVSATGLAERVEAIVKNNFSLPVSVLSLKSIGQIGPEWFVVLGCGLRGSKPRSEDKEISLLGVGAEEEFRREQFMEFFRLWRALVPLALGLLLLVFILADTYVIQSERTLETGSTVNLTAEQQTELQSLSQEAQSFNKSVDMIGSVEGTLLSKTQLWDKINGLLAADGVTLDRFYFQSQTTPMVLNGFAKSEDQIINFKNDLGKDSEFTGVNLDVTSIKSDPRGGFAFSLTFSLK